jgi:TusA-related sulfurtransferase
MRKFLPGSMCLSVAVFLALAAPLSGLSAPADRWLHVRVEKTGEEAESVRVNVPLTVAEKILPAIQARELRGGRLKIHHARIHGVDVRALLDAVSSLEDGEFLTVESDSKESVRLAKQGGYLLVKVDERDEKPEKVDIKIPFRVIEALLSGEEDELNLQAAVQALREHGDDVLVTVESPEETVRVWVDSENTAE